MLASAAGAHTLIDYRRDNVTDCVRQATQGRGVDRIIEVDVAANAAIDLELIRTGGECVVHGSGAPQVTLPFHPLIVKDVALRFFIVFNLDDDERQRAVAALTGFLERGALVHNIAERLPLEQIARAHELVESRPGPWKRRAGDPVA